VILFESDKENLISKACNLAKTKQIYLGLGLITVKKSALNSEKNGNPGFKNSFILINSEGQVTFEHQKARLVAGLEAPFFSPGEGVFHSYDIPEGRISAAICYEMVFPSDIRKAGKLGTEILIAPSSDWMGVKNIHSRMAVIRAVENGFSLLRPTSDGITLAVDPFGRIVGQIDYFISKRAFLITELPVQKINTLYTAIGDWLAWLCLIFSVSAIFYMLIRKKRTKKRFHNIEIIA
jgi:apolipoprotein N-acyltransferase